MKNNIFQKMLLSMFVAAALLGVNPLFASCQPKDFIGACGIFDEEDLKIALERAAVAKPNMKEVTKKFHKIVENEWRKEFRCYVFDNWYFWNSAQKALVIERMYYEGLISSEQMENWQNSPYPPCIQMQQKK